MSQKFKSWRMATTSPKRPSCGYQTFRFTTQPSPCLSHYMESSLRFTTTASLYGPARGSWTLFAASPASSPSPLTSWSAPSSLEVGALGPTFRASTHTPPSWAAATRSRGSQRRTPRRRRALRTTSITSRRYRPRRGTMSTPAASGPVIGAAARAVVCFSGHGESPTCPGPGSCRLSTQTLT